MNAVRLRQARLLVVPLWRARAWSLVPASAGLVLGVALAWRVSGHTTNVAAVGAAAGVLLAGTAAFAADDDSAPVVAPVPAPLAFRASVRLGGVVLLAAACWAAVLAYAVSIAPGVALARPTLLVATLVAVALLAGVTWGGLAGAPAVVAFAMAAARLPDRWSVLDPGAAAGRRLALLLAATTAAIAWRLRDPAWRRRTPPSPRTPRG